MAATARAEQPAIPFPKALDAAAVSVGRLDRILKDALIIGNGDINALVFSRDGQVRMVLTKNDVWDARLDTKLEPPIPTLKLIKKLAGQFPKAILLPEGITWKGPDTYSAHPYPCPRACARVTLQDRGAQPLRQDTLSGRLDLRRAVVDVLEEPGGTPNTQIRALAERNVFLIKSRLRGQLVPVLSADIPEAVTGESDGLRWLTQRLPGDRDWPGMDFAVAMAAEGNVTAVAIVTSREANHPKTAAIVLARSTIASDHASLVRRHEAEWGQFWARSGIDISDLELRDVWYRNLYFLRCVTKPGVISPGLFAGLIDDRPAWHGDYHTNYNLQQTFWSAYVTNHPELAEPYDRLIYEYLPRARWLCRRIFAVDGAYIPHVLYAYEPSHPDKCRSSQGRQYVHHVWGFTLGVSGFSVQPLWWHYKYAPDREFLEKLAYPAVRDVAVFQANFMDLCQGDEQVVLAPSVSPEHWGWTKNFVRNRNGTFDIAMFRYIFQAAIEGASVLRRDADLVARWKQALKRLPPYPTTKTDLPIVVDMQDAPPITYNLAVPVVPVFPGEQVTWFSPQAEKELFARTIERCRWNGNNSSIILSVARARLSMPETIPFMRRELMARSRPNGTLTLNRPGHAFNDFGHYAEQFGASMAVSELLLQSVGEVIRIFPAWPKDKPAAFRNLRAQGGFLVFANQEDGRVQEVAITSTVGGPMQLLSPWPALTVQRTGERRPVRLQPDAHGLVQLDTRGSERLVLRAAKTKSR